MSDPTTLHIERLRTLYNEYLQSAEYAALGVYPTQKDELVAAFPALLDAAEERDRLKDDIEHGRCCDDYTRLASCGHPRCCVSEGCELCVELGEATAQLTEERDDLRAQLDAVTQFVAQIFEFCHLPRAESGLLYECGGVLHTTMRGFCRILGVDEVSIIRTLTPTKEPETEEPHAKP